jgi:hypothetical protein
MRDLPARIAECLTTSCVPDGEVFVSRLRARPKHTICIQEVAIADLNRGALGGWTRSGRDLGIELRLLHGTYDGVDLRSLASLRRLVAQAYDLPVAPGEPTDDELERERQRQRDLELKERETERWTVCAIAKSSGELVGYAEESPTPGAPVHQTLSLDPEVVPAAPSLAQVSRALIGPITDLLTFYSDEWLVICERRLVKPGDRFRQTEVPIASWADGTFVVFGQDAINFDIELASVDTSSNVATVVVHHIPPAKSALEMPAPWMADRVADTDNNWAQVMRNRGAYTAAASKATFDARMKIGLTDAKFWRVTARLN